MAEIKKYKLNLNRKQCSICDYWMPLTGCRHMGAQDSDKNKELTESIVSLVHGGNKDIVETSDFMQGVNATLILLRQNGLLKYSL